MNISDLLHSFNTAQQKYDSKPSTANLNVLKTLEKDLEHYADLQRKELTASYKRKRIKIEHTGGVFVSPAQNTVASKIVKHFFQGRFLVTLIAQPQWGKTGTLLAAAFKMCTRKISYKLFDPDQVYIITGMSDTVWEQQTRERMIPQFQHNIYHRAQIEKAVPMLSTARNAIIIIDECHYASGTEQTIQKTLLECNLLDIENLRDRNVRIIQTSATPDNVLLDSQSWSEHHAIVTSIDCDSYVSFQKLHAYGSIHNSLDLTNPDDLENLTESILSFAEPKYHIIRLPRKGSKNDRVEIENNLRHICDMNDIVIKNHDSRTKIYNIDKLLEKSPKKHTVIIIVDYWRAAKTINTTHLGVVHERLVKNPNSTTVVQSLAGRCVGHNKNMDLLIFTHMAAVEEYIKLCENSFDYVATKYRSIGVRSNGEGLVKIKDSYAHSCEGIEHVYIVSTDISNRYGWKLFFGTDPLQKATRFVKKYLGTKLPLKKQNDHGFYVQNDVAEDPLYLYSKYFDSSDKPCNKRIFKGLSGNTAKKKTNWRQYALYKDLTDLSSLVWFVCWRKNVYPDAPSD